MGETGESARTVKLFCPSVSKLIQWVAWDEQRLDLGSIARAFGLDPSTVKLNGHFVSRGIDLVAFSVTWRSLLSFFSAKGLSTGRDDADALVVDGKLSKVGTKRAHDPRDCLDCIQSKSKEEPGCTERLWSKSSGLGLKRKQMYDKFGSAKKLKINEMNLGEVKDSPERVSGILAAPYKCSFMNETMKRVREDESLVASSCKRIR